MCTQPKVFDGVEVSCRECNECLATYKNTWVARCVAEKQTLPHAYAFTLTYADKDGGPPLGARVYRYKDVSDMWKRVRSAANRKWKNQGFQLRFVVVGEKGTRRGRCHYHGVAFTTHPIHTLGKFQGKRTNEFAYKRRLDWSLWGHGFVEFQEADRKGMAYVLKYILKSRMTASRSKGFAREGKTEWLASSYLWCSKRPAIGETWLFQKIQDLLQKGMCPPTLRVTVPGGGEWYVNGRLQKDMCLYLRDANLEYRRQRGKDLAGWNPLLESVQAQYENTETGEMTNRKAWEWLTNGETEENQTQQEPIYARAQWAQFQEQYARKRRVAGPITSARATVRACGNIRPCEACRNALSAASLADIDQEYLLRFDEWRQLNPQAHREKDTEYEQRFVEWWWTRLRISRGCCLRDDPVQQDRFRRLIPLIKAEPGLRGKAAIGKTLQKAPG